MNTKAFLGLLVAVLVLGGGIGGVLVIVAALGDSQEEEMSSTIRPAPLAPSVNQASQGGFDISEEGQPSLQLQPDESDQDTVSQLDGGAGVEGFAGGGVIGGRGGLVGSIEDNTITVNTLQGATLQATYGAETTVQMFTEVTLADLEIGMQVIVNGERGEDGTLQAQSVVITPEGAGGFLGGSFEGQDRLSDIRQRLQSGDISQEELARIREQFGGGQFGQGGFDRGQFGQVGEDGGQFGRGGFDRGQFGQVGEDGGQFGRGGFDRGQFDQDGGGLTGAIEQIEGSTITINTSLGPLIATVGEGTTIQMFTEGTLEDLTPGAQVRITGPTGEDGDSRGLVHSPDSRGRWWLFSAEAFSREADRAARIQVVWVPLPEGSYQRGTKCPSRLYDGWQIRQLGSRWRYQAHGQEGD